MIRKQNGRATVGERRVIEIQEANVDGRLSS